MQLICSLMFTVVTFENTEKNVDFFPKTTAQTTKIIYCSPQSETGVLSDRHFSSGEYLGNSCSSSALNSVSF